MSIYDDIKCIREHTPDAALYEQLAEEAVELAHAAIKYSRVLRKESPTPVTSIQAEMAIEEEYNDLLTVAIVAPAATQANLMIESKLARWAERLKEAMPDGKE
jgi:NTP pyrophosphatase (non-canonical NTP hydrolase)